MITMSRPKAKTNPKATGDGRPRPLIAASRLRRRVAELAREIARTYRGEPVVVVGILKGSFIFMADLVRRLPPPVRVEFLRVSSYGDRTETSGTVRVEFDLTQPVRGQHLLLVEDIIDTGLTARSVLAMMRAKRPKSVRLCALLQKPARKRVDVPIDFLGFTVPDRFVVGYGLDSMGLYRNLPYVGILDRD